MLAIILMNFIGKRKISKKSVVIFIVVCLISFPFANNYISIITDKFDSPSNNYISYERRNLDYSIDIKILTSNFKNFVIGIGEDKYIIQFTNLLNSTGKYSSLSASSSNSVTAFLAQHGVISSISLFSVYLSGIFSIKEKRKRYLFLITIMIILFTENFIVAPVFLVTAMKLLEYKKTGGDLGEDIVVNQ